MEIHIDSDNAGFESEIETSERNDVIEIKLGIFALICASLATTLVLLAIIFVKIMQRISPL